MSVPTTLSDKPTDIQKKGMNAVILTQCIGTLCFIVVNNNLLFLYLAKLGVSSAGIMFYLALPNLAGFILSIPTAFLSDRYGKKKIGTPGMVVTFISFSMIAVGGFIPSLTLARIVVINGVVLWSFAMVFQAASWFALIDPLVPTGMRGRFFGKLRFSWQLVSLIFSILCTFWVGKESSLRTLSILFVIIALPQFPRIFVYASIPELETQKNKTSNLKTAFMSVIGTPDFLSFCSYVFFLMLATSGCPILFALIEKNELSLNDNQIVIAAISMLIGSLLGFLWGGKPVDKYGTKPMFMICHFAFGFAIFVFVFRDLFPIPVFAIVLITRFFFGFIGAASSIAITTELLALVPKVNKSLATALHLALLQGGSGLSAILGSAILKLKILRDVWTIGPLTLNRYDSILLLYAVSIILLVITLGLVPSVIGKARNVASNNTNS